MANAKVGLAALLVLLGTCSVISSCDSKGSKDKKAYDNFHSALNNTYSYSGDYYTEFVRINDEYKEETIETYSDSNKFYCESTSYKDAESGYVLDYKSIEAVVSKDNRYVYYEEQGTGNNYKHAQYINEKDIKGYINYNPSPLYEDTILVNLMETSTMDKIEDAIKEYASGEHLVYEKHSITFNKSIVTLAIDFNVDLKGEEEEASIEYAKEKDIMSFTINDNKISSFKTRTEIEYKIKAEETPITSTYEFTYNIEYSYKSGLLETISLDGIEVQPERAKVIFYYGDYQLRNIYHMDVGEQVGSLFVNYFFNSDGFYNYDLQSGIIKFYLDKELTKEYVDETLPSGGLNLYIKLTAPSDRAIVVEMSHNHYSSPVDEGDTKTNDVIRVDKMFTSKSVELEGVTYNFDKRENTTREYVTVNGKKCEDKEITLEDGKLYEIMYYYNYSDRY